MSSLFDRFKKNKYRPFTPMSEDQLAYVEDIVTTTLLAAKVINAMTSKLCKRLQEDLSYLQTQKRKTDEER